MPTALRSSPTTKGPGPCPGLCGGPCWRSPALVAALALAACGGDDDDDGTSSGGTPAQSSAGGEANVTEQLFAGTAADNRENARRGQEGRQADRPLGRRRRLHGPRQDVLHVRDRDHERDPPRAVRLPARRHGRSPCRTSRRTMPEISEDGKTVTVKLKKGVTFSQPVSREVTSKDVKYAIERALHGQRRQRLRGRLLRRPRGRAEGAGRRTRRSRASRRRTTRRSSSSSPRAPARRSPARSRCRSRSRCRRSTPRSTTRRTRRPTARATRSTPARTWSSPTPRARPPATCPGKQHPPRPQPGLRGRRRLPPRLPGRDRHPGRQRRHVGGDAPHPLGREHGVGRDRAAGQPAQAAAAVQQDRAVRRPGRRLAHDLDGHEPAAVRRHQRPQGRHRRLQPRRRAPAARRRGARPDRPALHPAGHGRASRSPTASRAGPTRWTGWPDARGRPRSSRPSTSRRPASPRASTRATRPS